MGRFDAVVGLDRVAIPKLIEELSEEEIIARLMADFVEAFPEFADNTEYEIVQAVFHVAAYQELMVRQLINQSGAAAMLVSASGGDLNLHGYARGVIRQTIDPGDPDAVPPRLPVYEADDAYRLRIQLAPESWSVAGPEGAYAFWAKSVPGIRDAVAVSPAPAEVVLTVMSWQDDGTVDQGLLDAVFTALDDKRPIADRLSVQSVKPVPFTLKVTLRLLQGPAQEVVEAASRAALDAYLADRYLIGRSLTLSNLHDALVVEGVEEAIIHTPAGGLAIGDDEVAYLTADPEIIIEVAE